MCWYAQRVQRPKIEIKMCSKGHMYHQMTKKQTKNEKIEKIIFLWNMLIKNQARQLIDLNNKRMEIKCIAWFCCMKMKLIEARGSDMNINMIFFAIFEVEVIVILRQFEICCTS